MHSRARKADLLLFITLGLMLHKLLSKVLFTQDVTADFSYGLMALMCQVASFSFALLSPDVQSGNMASADA